jgi:hypothetical protein
VIVLSLVLLAAAGVLLVLGILRGDGGTVLLAASIVSTLAAATLLYLGVRPTGGRSAAAGRPDPKAGDTGGETTAPAAVDAPAAGAAKDERTAADRTRVLETASSAGGAPARTVIAGAAGAGAGAGATRGTGGAGAGATRGTGGAGAGATRGTGGAHAQAAGSGTAERARGAGTGTLAGPPSGKPAATAADAPAGTTRDASGGAVEVDPPDEPGIESAQLGDLARVAGRDDEVLVVDGRPRYHVTGCAHLTDRESEGLPVSEAAELGFTPCARCAPVATLLG